MVLDLAIMAREGKPLTGHIACIRTRGMPAMSRDFCLEVGSCQEVVSVDLSLLETCAAPLAWIARGFGMGGIACTTRMHGT